MINTIKEQITNASTKIDIIIIVMISLLSGLSGYLHDLVNSEEKFRKIVLFSRSLNAMLAGYIVGSLLSYYKVEPQIIYAVVGVTGWRGGMILEHLSKAFLSIIPELLLRIRVAIHLLISPEQHAMMKDRLKNGDPYSMPINEHRNNNTSITQAQPSKNDPTPIIQPSQQPINTPSAPVFKKEDSILPTTLNDEELRKQKLLEAKKKLGLK